MSSFERLRRQVRTLVSSDEYGIILSGFWDFFDKQNGYRPNPKDFGKSKLVDLFEEFPEITIRKKKKIHGNKTGKAEYVVFKDTLQEKKNEAASSKPSAQKHTTQDQTERHSSERNVGGSKKTQERQSKSVRENQEATNRSDKEALSKDAKGVNSNSRRELQLREASSKERKAEKGKDVSLKGNDRKEKKSKGASSKENQKVKGQGIEGGARLKVNSVGDKTGSKEYPEKKKLVEKQVVVKPIDSLEMAYRSRGGADRDPYSRQRSSSRDSRERRGQNGRDSHGRDARESYNARDTTSPHMHPVQMPVQAGIPPWMQQRPQASTSAAFGGPAFMVPMMQPAAPLVYGMPGMGFQNRMDFPTLGEANAIDAAARATPSRESARDRTASPGNFIVLDDDPAVQSILPEPPKPQQYNPPPSAHALAANITARSTMTANRKRDNRTNRAPEISVSKEEIESVAADCIDR